MFLEPPDLISAQKALAHKPKWASEDKNNLVLACPVSVRGIVLEGAQIRMTALRPRPDEAVTFQLEFLRPLHKFRPACRVEWRPLHGHNNKGCGPLEYRHREIKGSHHHVFEHNWLGETEEMRSGNLPVAIPIIPDPEDFHSFLDFVGQTLRITGLGLVDPPPCEGVFL